MKQRKYLILGIVLVLILGIGSTFAWYVWQSSDDEVKTISATLGVANVIYKDGSNIHADIMPVATKEEGVIKEVSVRATNSTSYNLTFNLYLDILEMDDIFKHESFRYAIYKDDTMLKEGNFTEEFRECTVNNTTHLVLVENERITTNETTYTLYLWIDGVNYTNPSEMQNKYIALKLHAYGENAITGGSVIGPSNAVDFITALYDSSDKVEVFNNDIAYNYAPDVSLMNDGLGYGKGLGNWINFGGEFSDQANCYDYFDCETYWSEWEYDSIDACELDNLNILQNEFNGVSSVDELCSVNSTGGNIRYYGASPNNYIDIGDVFTEYTTVNGWEIAGWSYEDEESCHDDWYGGSTIEEWCQINWEDGGWSNYDDCVTNSKHWLFEDTGFTSIHEFCGEVTFSAGTTKSLYRIIGVFKDVELADGTTADLIKVVRESSIGMFSWDTSSSDINGGEGINEWSQADIMKLLNPGFETNTDELCVYDEELGDFVCNTTLVNNSLWWNSGNGNFYWNPDNGGGTSYLSYAGLSSNVHNKIASVVWNLGSHNDNAVYPNQIYFYERDTQVLQEPEDGVTRTTAWTGKVALMYPSDIGYAVDFNVCDVSWGEYNDDCFENNYFEDIDGYLLTANYDNPTKVWTFTGGFVTHDWSMTYGQSIVPTFYLKADSVLVSGNGSIGNPYKLK